jgi:hypothetical protein
MASVQLGRYVNVTNTKIVHDSAVTVLTSHDVECNSSLYVDVSVGVVRQDCSLFLIRIHTADSHLLLPVQQFAHGTSWVLNSAGSRPLKITQWPPRFCLTAENTGLKSSLLTTQTEPHTLSTPGGEQSSSS